jgi:putative transcriptional regulator
MSNDVTEALSKQQLSDKIGEKIKSIRTALSISQSELGRRCGKDKQHIELIENGKVSPNIYTIYLIANGLNCPLGELLTW